MPLLDAFRDAESYYGTVLHELVHWTRHCSRLDRDLGRKRFGDAGYALEELVAELGAAFLCADLDLASEPRPDHASYIDHWLTVLRGDKRAIFAAAGHARRAADYLNRMAGCPQDSVRFRHHTPLSAHPSSECCASVQGLAAPPGCDQDVTIGRK